MYRAGLIIEQSLGHITHGQNIRYVLAQDPTIQALWGLPPYEVKGLAAKIPGYNSNWTLRAGLLTRRELAKMQRQSALDVLFFHTQVTAVLAQDWIRRIPSVVSLDATPKQIDQLGQFYAHDKGPAWLEDWKWRLNRDSFRAARRLVTWSEWARDGLVSDYEVPAEKIVVIPPGVNLDLYGMTEARRAHAGPVKILFVGGDFKRKGGLDLLEAFRRLRRDFAEQSAPEVELHLVTRERLQPEAGVHVYNNLQPNTGTLIQLYHDSDIFCLPTYGDCLAMASAEAGAAGLPVVTSRVAAMPEIVKDGDSGFLVDAGNVVGLEAALRRLALDPDLRLRQGLAGAKKVREKFNTSCNAGRIVSLLKEVVDEERSRRAKR